MLKRVQVAKVLLHFVMAWLIAPAIGSTATAAAPDVQILTPPERPYFAEGRVDSRAGLRRLAFGHAGRISKVAVAAGDRVQRNQLLATMDCSGLKADLAVVEAELELGRLIFARRKQGPSAAELEIAKERLALAQADLATAQVAHDRLESLFRQNGLISKQELEAAARRSIVARLEVATKQQAFELAQNPVRIEDELENSTRERASVANVARVRHQLALCEIASPGDGIVVAVHLKSGEMANAGASVISVFDDRVRSVSAWIPESEPQVRSGQKVRIRIPALQERSFDGVISSVSPAVAMADGSLSSAGNNCLVDGGTRVWIDTPAQLSTVPIFSVAYVYLAAE